MSVDIPVLKVYTDDLGNLINYIYSHEKLLNEFGALKFQLDVDCELALKKRDIIVVLDTDTRQIMETNSDEPIYHFQSKVEPKKSNEKSSLSTASSKTNEELFWSNLSSCNSTRPESNITVLRNKTFFSQRPAQKSFTIHRLPKQSLLQLGGTQITNQFVSSLTKSHGSGSTTPLNYTRQHLSSFIYHHCGGARHWYIIPNSEIENLQEMIQNENLSVCLDHSQLLMDPKVFDKYNIRYHKTIQHPTEIVILSSGSLSQSFFEDSSWSESIDFALPSWIEQRHAFASCECEIKNENKPYRINLDLFRRANIQRYINKNLTIHPTQSEPIESNDDDDDDANNSVDQHQRMDISVFQNEQIDDTNDHNHQNEPIDEPIDDTNDHDHQNEPFDETIDDTNDHDHQNEPFDETIDDTNDHDHQNEPFDETIADENAHDHQNEPFDETIADENAHDHQNEPNDISDFANDPIDDVNVQDNRIESIDIADFPNEPIADENAHDHRNEPIDIPDFGNERMDYRNDHDHQNEPYDILEYENEPIDNETDILDNQNYQYEQTNNTTTASSNTTTASSNTATASSNTHTTAINNRSHINKNGKTLFVARLRNDVNKNDLRKCFIGCLKVTIKQNRADPQLKYAFVVHRTSQEAAFNFRRPIDYHVLGSDCIVEYAYDHSTPSTAYQTLNNKKLMISGIPENVSENVLHQLFVGSHIEKYYPTRYIHHSSTTGTQEIKKILPGYAFILYDDEQKAASVVKNASQYKINGHALAISVYRDRK